MARKPEVESALSKDVRDRIKAVLERFPTRKDAVIAVRISEDQLAKYIAGTSSPSFATMARLAAATGVSLDWIAAGGPLRATPVQRSAEQGLSVIGLAECGLRGWYQRDLLSVTASRPGDFLDPDGFAVIAIGQSMRPAGIAQGFLCFCSPRTAPTRGDAVYVERQDGAATIKIFQSMDDEWLTLEGWLDPEGGRQEPYIDRFLLATVQRVAPVIYIKRKL